MGIDAYDLGRTDGFAEGLARVLTIFDEYYKAGMDKETFILLEELREKIQKEMK